ncbi:MAG: acetyl-CoA carboxylase biotin carboxylase subunit [Candidatus Latescibacteria bacterium]|nr:acetyl-CoA carboxylase biotin carboxylase subunit [Candidatus Latescibacterota bacterium]NIM21754.1 acetyl-CoA carboxylase biotin carboxylase subunit [Candidatus Latescibacterota bacterium]NIM65892.1 acetyl-CoA carboxylase biotin carboxylase subunit [Candidatus Latescibacterota bacterium]NIO02637.1 acetyl-CoA carboxylase biotin carboxylase subunit [Candidatus Latescibacterota bacterium]NIO29618.1 acetyl-CoA carboxylase biotin carboxylase subunit [Candidatus Latescibacterota bacterium]
MNKVLVPNRGEIAVRVIRACKELDIPVVAAYSEADIRSLHVQLADEAVCIGPPSPLESYLNIDAIVRAARETGCDAVHPGYGFLAENDRFAERLEKEGITFIGPPSPVIRAMGSKIQSRAIMKKAGIPIIPGSLEGSDDVDEIMKAARKIDGPIFLKASAGGGGKGMRLVLDRTNLESLVREAVGEARSAFGDGTIYIEKYIESPRHIEFQILADSHGSIVHLFERECSVQRRHQKVLEETPSTALDDKLRKRMGKAAVSAARAAGYRNAGTVEFMFGKNQEFYFLEMNTRIQVEHPITEFTTGVDLVKWQIRIARGEELDFRQEDLVQRGHAIECRIYAEDSAKNFIPSCGVITLLKEPWGPGIRNDSGIYEGWEVSPYYDPILSKLVAYGENREAAIKRMQLALDSYVIHGIETSIDLHKRILSNDTFIKGETYTSFIEAHQDEILGSPDSVPVEAFIAAALAEELGGAGVTLRNETALERPTPWHYVGKWEIGGGR